MRNFCRPNRRIPERPTFTHFVFLSLFLIGFIFSILFLFYLVSAIIFVFGEASYPGDIAYIPKPLFLLAFLTLLGYSRKVKDWERFI